jgi:hypothetical protein
MSLPAEQQRERRERLRKQGYRRLDLYLSPDLFARLLPHIRPHGGDRYPGFGIARLLEERVQEWDEPE